MGYATLMGTVLRYTYYPYHMNTHHTLLTVTTIYLLKIEIYVNVRRFTV